MVGCGERVRDPGLRAAFVADGVPTHFAEIGIVETVEEVLDLLSHDLKYNATRMLLVNESAHQSFIF